MKVFKYGGTSVGSPERIRSMVQLINDGERKLVVFSAMAGTTNLLVEISAAIRDGDVDRSALLISEMRTTYTQVINDLFSTSDYREKAERAIAANIDTIAGQETAAFSRSRENVILAQGELISTTLIHLYMEECGISSLLLPALNFMRIDKDGEPDYFYISENLSREISGHNEHQILITQGFICRNAYGETDNLRRGGSDYSASIIASVLNAEEIQIWTDISGFHNNDPRFVEGTAVIRELSFDEAAELAYFGAKILHPSTMIPAREKGIPVVLKNTLVPDDPGTVIALRTEPADYKAIAAKDGITILRITSDRMLMAYGFLRKVFEQFELYRTPIDMVATSEVSVSVTVDDSSNLEEIIRELSRFSKVEVEADQSIICIVGDFRPERVGSAPEVFEALNSFPVKMISYGASSNSISIIIDSSDKIMALRSLHKTIFEGYVQR